MSKKVCEKCLIDIHPDWCTVVAGPPRLVMCAFCALPTKVQAQYSERQKNIIRRVTPDELSLILALGVVEGGKN